MFPEGSAKLFLSLENQSLNVSFNRNINNKKNANNTIIEIFLLLRVFIYDGTSENASPKINRATKTLELQLPYFQTKLYYCSDHRAAHK